VPPFPHIRSARLVFAGCIALSGWSNFAHGQQSTVTLRAVIGSKSASKQDKSDKAKVDASDVVMWLKPLDSAASESAADAASHRKWQLIQHNKSFQPHVLVIPVGAVVEFPNRDPYFHNVFSLFDGKRFDLGLYEAGATNAVRFDRLGVSFLFCNIHSEMSAVVVAVDTNYFGVSGRNGYITIANVPEGKYELHVWYERSLPEDLKSLTRVVTVSSPAADLGAINVPENPSFSPSHKNKYGQDYAPPSTPTYSHP
jgi:plastocyanin